MKKFTSVFLILVLVFSSMLGIGTEARAEKVYYLFGYINGANYACEEDYQNMGEYRFTDGKLSARFDKVSYVAVKEADNANWYMTDGWMGDVHSVQLFNTEITRENSNKLKVPEGVDVNFTLNDNGDGSLTLSYTAENEGYPIRAQFWDYVYIEIEQIINAPGNYWTEETEKPFLKALKEAKEVLDNKNATDKQLINAYDSLKIAEQNLKKQDNEYWKNKLAALTAEYSMDFEDKEYMYSLYTKDSFDKYYEAYKQADKAIANDELFLLDLSEAYYNLKNSRDNLVRLDGKETDTVKKPYYKTDEFETLLNIYGGEIGIGGNVMNNEVVERKRTLDGKDVTEYRGLRIFNAVNGIEVFGLSDMLCTVGEEVIDGYKFNNPVFDGGEKNKTGLCVYANGKILSIKDAVSLNLVAAEKLAEVIPYTEKGGTIPTLPVPTEKPTTSAATLPTVIDRPTMPIIIPDDTGYYVDDNTEDPEDKVTEPEDTVSVQIDTKKPTDLVDNITVEPTETVTEEKETYTVDPTETVTEEKETYTVDPTETVTEGKETFTVEPTETVTVGPTEIFTADKELDKTEPSYIYFPTDENKVETKGEAETTESETVKSEKPTVKSAETKAVKVKTANKKQSAKKIIKKANPIKVSVNPIKLKAKKLKKNKTVIKPLKIKKAKGTISIKKIKKGTSANIFGKISVNVKTGAITLKKGKYLKKSYKIKLKITVKGNSKFKSKVLYKTIKVKIK